MPSRLNRARPHVERELAIERRAGIDAPDLAEDGRESRPSGIVGIGASAGGLRALQQFFGAVTPDTGLAYVVIMHLDPERESRIAELLQNSAAIPVSQVTGETRVEADHIYVIPPEQDLAMDRGVIRLRDRAERTHHTPVDLFLTTLAEAYGTDAIGVILSGTGTDGTSGLRTIKENGGITVAQDPDEAEFGGMPASAIATGQVDLVLAAAAIPDELIRLRLIPALLGDAATPEDTDAQLSRIFSVLRGKTGHDFSLYKRSMVLRRLERRLRFAGISTLDEYHELLRTSETEFAALLRDLLISVSSFFRDPEAFRALENLIPKLFEGKGAGDSVRVWVVGCATGEEAYSIAVLLHEHASTLDEPPRIQIFATDIDETAYSRGREAIYPATAATAIPPERLRRFFSQEAGQYRVMKALRDGVLFAVHNVLRDAPFSRIDLISCRNLLIYLQPEAQSKVLETFHYALRPGGLLFLGRAESAGEGGLFAPVAKPQRIYRRETTPHVVLPRLSFVDPPQRMDRSDGYGRRPKGDASFSYGAIHLRMLEEYGPPSLIVDDSLNVVHRSEAASRYLHYGSGQSSHNVLDLTEGDLRLELRTALHGAFTNGIATTRRVRINGPDDPILNLQVHPPFGDDRNGRRFAMIVFREENGRRAPLAALSGPIGREAIAHLEDEVREKRELLDSTVAAYDKTVEELQSTNEELQSANEEQKAAGEELETSREEIQSMNEELTTINQEYQNTIEELQRTNADLANLIESTEIATIFLDEAMRIRRFTPATAGLFNFMNTDQGRPLAHITHHLVYPELVQDVKHVLSSLERVEREVTTTSGEWFVMRISPYRSVDGSVEGAIITFSDNTERKRVEIELREARLAALDTSRLKGNFLATASHEFRTPLNGILGYLDLLDLEEPLNPLQAYRVDRIRACGVHLASMIEEILTVAQLESGGVAVIVEELDAGGAASEAAELVEPIAQAKGLAIHLDLPDEPISISTDATKLRHILLNLCGNAVKYTVAGQVRVGVRADGDDVVFEVRDTGVGIARENLDRIFDPFWQVDGASTRAGEGMGIGLATVREYARLLGASVEVESELGQGSCFRVRMNRDGAGAGDQPA